MKRALLAYQYGMANAGDFAINIGSLDLLENLYDELVVISKSTSNDTEYENEVKYLEEYYSNIKVIEGPFNLNRTSLLKTLKSYFLGAIKYTLLLRYGKYIKEIENSDVVFINGGNILRCESITDYVRLHALLFPIKIAKKLNVNSVFLPHSTTSIDEKGKKLLDPYIRSAKILFARENISYDKLTQEFPNSNIVQSLDSAFFIKDRDIIKEKYDRKYEVLSKKSNNICITLRKEDIGDIGELDKEKIALISSSIQQLIHTLLEQSYTITFVVQTRKDKEFTQELYDMYASNSHISIIEEYDPLLLREVYRNSVCLFGMRLHSMILAMSVGTPVVGCFDQRWGSKNPGTLGRFQMIFMKCWSMH
jgi:polysaccharide pyruvyl transferase WcaK-like protein